MMLCKADFDEIFDPGQERTDAARPASGPAHPDKACLARWEDDGGRVLPARIAQRDQRSLPVSDQMRIGMALATMPAAAAYGAAWTMRSTYHQMTRS